ncbi:hypothetical protein [Micromonospora sp. LOL_024]|uniref:hypothetical protein n=1 Tax=Micromonospora sp. LOL_024 TaxID=3345412 RepID=UPI003A8AFFED
MSLLGAAETLWQTMYDEMPVRIDINHHYLQTTQLLRCLAEWDSCRQTRGAAADFEHASELAPLRAAIDSETSHLIVIPTRELAAAGLSEHLDRQTASRTTGCRLHRAEGTSCRSIRSVYLNSCLEPSFVQPLPDGAILLVDARSRGGPNAEIWAADGTRLRQGHLGDAIENVLTTPSGAIWVGYFDEAMGGAGPQVHGLARFAPDLEPGWVYPQRADLPPIDDCYALNVAGERAWSCAYTAFHLVAVDNDQAIDYGMAPQRGAAALLTDGSTGAMVGGYGPEYDLVTPFHIVEDRTVTAGGQCRLVLPDGLEVRERRIYGRGTELHVFIGRSWYRVDLAQVTRGR